MTAFWWAIGIGVAVMVALGVLIVVCSLIGGKLYEQDRVALHDGASMRAQRRRELYDRNRAQEEAARPDAEIVEFPHRGPGAA